MFSSPAQEERFIAAFERIAAAFERAYPLYQWTLGGVPYNPPVLPPQPYSPPPVIPTVGDPVYPYSAPRIICGGQTAQQGNVQSFNSAMPQADGMGDDSGTRGD